MQTTAPVATPQPQLRHLVRAQQLLRHGLLRGCSPGTSTKLTDPPCGGMLTWDLQVGSIFEYLDGNAVFGVIPPDSPLWAPVLGLFTFTGIPMAGALVQQHAAVAQTMAALRRLQAPASAGLGTPDVGAAQKAAVFCDHLMC